MNIMRSLALVSIIALFSTLTSQAEEEKVTAASHAPLHFNGNESLFAPSNLLAWCIIPYDNQHRTPAQRLAMLKELGFTQYVWDWRQQHLKDFPQEIELSRKAGITIRAAWLWIDEKSDRVGQLSESNRAVIDAVKQAQLPIDYWVGFSPNVFEGLDDAASVRKGAALIAYLRDIAVTTGSSVALYNHGDWFGEPENEIKIIKAAGGSSLGMVYNFHHGHTQTSRFKDFLPLILPYLKAVNLSGVRPEGPKILPIGQGSEERRMIGLLTASGYKGPIGILGHIEDADVRDVLKRNLEGLKQLQSEKEH